MQTTWIRQKAYQFHMQVARQKRQQIIARKRLELVKQHSQFPLKSQFLQKYWQIPQTKLYLHRDEIFETLDNINGQQLSQEQSQQLCHDLIHMFMHDNDFLIPYTMKFPKNQSQLTATVVAFAYDCLDMQEGNYWLKYMNDDCRNSIYLNLQIGDDVTRYLGDTLLLETIVDDWGHLQQAQDAIGYLLGEIKIGQQTQFVQAVFDKLHWMNKKSQLKSTPSFLIIVMRLMCHYQLNNKIYSFLSIVLNESIHKLYTQNPDTQLDSSILFAVDILQDRNRQQCKVIFNHLNFQYLLKMILNYYLGKFAHNQGNQQTNKKKLSKQKLDKIRSNFINRLIDICMNHLRIHRLYKNHISLDPHLINSFKPQPLSNEKLQEKYQKLVEFNNLYLKQKTQNLKNQSTFKRSYQELQI